VSIPTPGWLSFTTNQPAISAPLPVVNVISYGDGAQGTYTTPSEEPTIVVSRVEGVPPAIEAQAGLIGNTYGFSVEIQIAEAYSVALIDSVDPADKTQVIEDTVDEPKVIEPCGDLAPLGAEFTCEFDGGWILDGTYFLDGSKFLGVF